MSEIQGSKISIYIDADSCPKIVRDHVIDISQKFNLPLFFVANHEIAADEGQSFNMILCPSEKDAADDYIVQKVQSGVFNTITCADDKYNFSFSQKVYTPQELVQSGSDIVITRDLLLAKRLVDKDVCVLNDRGVFFTRKNIDSLLKEREEDLMYVSMGLVKHSKGSVYNKKEFAAFANSFDKIISEI